HLRRYKKIVKKTYIIYIKPSCYVNTSAAAGHEYPVGFIHFTTSPQSFPYSEYTPAHPDFQNLAAWCSEGVHSNNKA
ncbi:hypothetical protein, partial [Enterocloster bolteae]|uniref:hypothetical protein n=1 Tax=Enterocloster bolteae TaxID=208479 RepID=UPI002A840A42